MPVKTKRRYTARDRLAAHLVILIVFVLLLMGAIGLYLSGIFTPVTGTVSMQNTPELELEVPTKEPTSRLLDWLFPSAMAEESAPAETADENVASTDADALEADAAGEPETVEDLEALFAQIVEEERGESDITDADRVTVDKKDLAINPNLPEEWYNVLLMATDSRDIRADSGRTDVMIIASIHQKTGEIKLTSLSRDMYVQIPNTSGSNRINTAYAFGRANLAMKTVNHTFEMNISDYVLVNFHVMAEIVDSLGGVDIQLHGNEWEMLNAIVDVAEDFEGFSKTSTRRRLTEQDADTVVHMDGVQAVSYARVRKSDSDIQRGSRQRVLLQKMMDKIMENATIGTLLSMFNSVSRTADTNIVVSKMMELGSMMLMTEPTITEFALPAANTFKNSTEKDSKGKEMMVLSVNIPQNTKLLHEFIYGEYHPAQTK